MESNMHNKIGNFESLLNSAVESILHCLKKKKF